MVNDKEQILIHELKKGQNKAFDEIYRMYAKRLLGYCLQYTKAMEDAEEIVQDVFVQLWNSRKIIRQEESLKSLLFIMTKNHLINAYRTRINSPIYEDYVNYQAELSVDDTNYHLAYEEFMKVFNAALKKLSDTQQKIIRLSRLSNLSNKEIAETLSLSEQTIKNQLSLGLKILRKEMKEL